MPKKRPKTVKQPQTLHTETVASRCRLLELPAEILHMIYEELFVSSHPIDISPRPRLTLRERRQLESEGKTYGDRSLLPTTFLRVCRRFHEEATPILWRKNHFQLCPSDFKLLEDLAHVAIPSMQHLQLNKIETPMRECNKHYQMLLRNVPLREFVGLQKLDIHCTATETLLETTYPLLHKARCDNKTTKIQIILDVNSQQRRYFPGRTWIMRSRRPPVGKVRNQLPPIPFITFYSYVERACVIYIDKFQYPGWNMSKTVVETGEGVKGGTLPKVTYTLTR